MEFHVHVRNSEQTVIFFWCVCSYVFCAAGSVQVYDGNATEVILSSLTTNVWWQIYVAGLNTQEELDKVGPENVWLGNYKTLNQFFEIVVGEIMMLFKHNRQNVLLEGNTKENLFSLAVRTVQIVQL